MPIRHSVPVLLSSALLAPWFAASPFATRSAVAQTSGPAAKVAPVTVEEPRDVVAAIYKLAAAQAKKDTSPFFDRAARAKYFSKGFDLLVTTRETKAAHDGDAALDFDPVSASQDAEIQKVTLKTDVLEQAKAVVSATFLNHKQPTVVTYDFIREGGEWKVNDIKGTTEKEAWSVRKILKADAAEPTTLPGMPDAKAAPDATLPLKDAPLPPKKDDAAR